MVFLYCNLIWATTIFYLSLTNVKTLLWRCFVIKKNIFIFVDMSPCYGLYFRKLLFSTAIVSPFACSYYYQNRHNWSVFTNYVLQNVFVVRCTCLKSKQPFLVTQHGELHIQANTYKTFWLAACLWIWDLIAHATLLPNVNIAHSLLEMYS